MPLGVFEDASWRTRVVEVACGDLLVLYTDGITEAQDNGGDFFGTERLLQTVQASSGRSAQAIHDALIAEVRRFVGDVPQFDDITLMIVSRQSQRLVQDSPA